jgi:membrane protease YdiL (CAAX protease family)
MKTCRYNVIHAVLAAIVMVFVVSDNFWHNFLYGAFSKPPPASAVHMMLGLQVAIFGLLLLVLWASTLFMRKPPDAPEKPSRLHAILFALYTFVPICLIAFALMFGSTAILEKGFGIKAAGQDLVTWLQPGTYPLSTRILLMVFAVFEAPLIEEPLFRGIMFRGFAKVMPIWVAMAMSGFVFALIHVNAASFLSLWFLGYAFAWLYLRTGSILAPMTAHFLFNSLNLIFVLLGLNV